jgi:periplasmic mercuric ion binding protein
MVDLDIHSINQPLNTHKMKQFGILMLLLLTSFQMQAQEKKNKNAKHTIEVNGNCEMCKKRIEKAALSVKGVKVAVWHQDHQDIHLTLDETKCTLDDVHQAITKAGHDTDKMKADDAVYEKLHTCCLYERKE